MTLKQHVSTNNIEHTATETAIPIVSGNEELYLGFTLVVVLTICFASPIAVASLTTTLAKYISDFSNSKITNLNYQVF